MESSAQLLHRQAAVDDARYSPFKPINNKHPPVAAAAVQLAVSSSVLQGIDDASCAGLKNLLLGAINKCLLNTKDAVQVFLGLINTAPYDGLIL